LLAGILFSLPVAADINDLLEMSEKLDKIERQDFGDAIDKANGCTRARDFACTSSWLGKASKLANGARDKQVLATAQQNMANEKARIAEEARLRAEEERRIAEAEERLRIAEAEAARRSSESSGPSTAMQLFQMGTAIMGSMAAEKARIAAAAANSTRSSSGGLPLADLSAERRAIEKARADAAAAQRAREQSNAARAAAANASRVVAAPQPTQAADRREQTIASRMAAANTQSVYSTPQPTIEPSRENCPPGFKPSTNPRTVPGGAFCVSDPQYAGGPGGQGSSGSASRSGSASTRTASNSSGGSAGSSNSGGSGYGGGSSTGGNTNTGGYPNSGGNPNSSGYPSGGSSQTPGGSPTAGGSSNTRVATTGGGLANTGNGYPNLDRPSGGSQPKKLYPLIRHFTFPTLGDTEQEACAEAAKKVDEQYSRSYNQSRMVSRGSCSCTKEAFIYGSIYQCKIPVTDELMVDYDPNAPTSATSK
jgi:hypothetical protein